MTVGAVGAVQVVPGVGAVGTTMHNFSTLFHFWSSGQRSRIIKLNKNSSWGAPPSAGLSSLLARVEERPSTRITQAARNIVNLAGDIVVEWDWEHKSGQSMVVDQMFGASNFVLSLPWSTCARIRVPSTGATNCGRVFALQKYIAQIRRLC